MQDALSQSGAGSPEKSTAARDDRLQHSIAHAKHLLPAQGPINVFIHHNTLHAFEDETFEQGVMHGARVFGCEPFLSEDRYRQLLASGRIHYDDLVAVLHSDLGDDADTLIGSLGTRFHMRLLMLEHPLRHGSPQELRWFVAETDALTRLRPEVQPLAARRLLGETRRWVEAELNGESALRAVESSISSVTRERLSALLLRYDRAHIPSWSERQWEAFTLRALWQACREGVRGVALPERASILPLRHRDLLRQATGQDSDLLVNELLIRFCAAFLDQGFAVWTLPHRELGLFRSFCELYRLSAGSPERWLQGLSSELDRIQRDRITPRDSILESLDLLGVESAEWDEFISATFLALRGWAGMIWQLEDRGDRVALPAPPESVEEFLAIRLILDRFALAHVARETLGYRGSLADLRRTIGSTIQTNTVPSVEQRAFLVFQLAQLRAWSPPALMRLSPAEWNMLIGEIELFSQLERRRVFHQAFERRYRNQTLDAFAIHARRASSRPASPRFQAMFCLDEREESIRRHLEEVAPETETFSAAGFYSVAIYYRGAADAHFVPLCPIVIRPKHWMVEDVAFTQKEAHRRRAKTRRALGTASHQVHVGSRGLAGGALLTAGLGVLASIPLIARVLFPRLTALVHGTALRFVEPPSATTLRLERWTAEPGPEEDQVGFSVAEMTDNAERLLRDIGLTSSFARLVAIIGHGSNSLNNPHNSAYNCGACGGSAGGPNARAMAQMLNEPRIRAALEQRGLPIPRETVFVGGLHNTCNDSVTFFDLDRLPKSHHAEFSEFNELLDMACDRNAHERCRRFESASLQLSFAAARRHVEARSEDLAQARPECGHASNAVCYVGRRQRTRGLFLDRRTFVTSYDPMSDVAEQPILTRILQAAVPVCAGINLEYYFSYVDSAGYGCGTKLPHNVASLLGVMDGAASDLRTGLPWQMVEIHEPVRLLFVVETTPEVMFGILEREAGLGRLFRNGWVQLATLDPDSEAVHLLVGDKFERYRPETTELPHVRSSTEWYQGRRDNLGYAVVET